MKKMIIFFTSVLYVFLPSSIQAQSAANQSVQKIDKPKQTPEKKQKGKSSKEKESTSAISKIDINQADVSMLTKFIKGIGVKKAEAIVKYRMKHGHFKSFNELAQIKGFGENFIQRHLKELEKYFTIN